MIPEEAKDILEKIREGKIVSVSKDVAIFFKDMRLVNPALDANPHHNLILTVPFPAVRTVETKRGQSVDKADIALMCITDCQKLEDRFFEATDENFLKKGWLARVPSPDLTPRWSMQSIAKYLYEKPESVSPAECYQACLAQFDRFLDFGIEGAPETCSVYTLLTYVYIVFEYVPYLKFGGEKESGKSKAGSVFANLAFNAKITLNETSSSMFRFAQDNRGVLIIDEGEELHIKDEKLAAIQQILNGGFQKTGAVTRINKDTMRPERYFVFGPKIICSILPLFEVLETRTLEIIMLKTNNVEKSNLEPTSEDPVWQPIRDNIYLCLLQNWRRVKDLEKVKNEYGLSGRFWNLAKPLLVVAKWIDESDPEKTLKVEDKVLRFLEAQIKSKLAKNVSSLTSSILLACEQILEAESKDGTSRDDYQFRIKLSDVVQKVREIEEDTPDAQGKHRIQSRKVSGILTNLRLYTEPERAGKGYSFLVSKREIEDMKGRFSMGLERKEAKLA